MGDGANITPEMASRVLDANWKNVVKKVGAGKTLNATELAVIKTRAAGSHDTVTQAKDLTELARVLGVSRQTIYSWKKRKDAPKPTANGTHDVVAWREFIRVHDLKAGLSPDAEVLKARKLLAEIEDRELKVALKKGQYLLKSEVEGEWSRRMAVLKNLLYAKLTLELPPLCMGRDAVSIQQLNQSTLDAVLKEAAVAV
jgi:predicted DNA-binding transcriptional regulator AlpA